MMTPSTKLKRKQLNRFIQQVLVHETAVKGVVGIGSIATGRMRPDSDIDAVIFLDPYDPYIVPAEAIWDAKSDTFHSIFIEDERLHTEGIQLDFARLDWQTWAEPDCNWPEGRRAELASGWLAYDPSGEVEALIDEQAAYPESLRLARLDEAITWLDQHLGENGPKKRWESLDSIIAHDRLHAAYHYLVQGLFAYNRQWRVWRNREMSALLELPWLPVQFEQRILTAANAPGLDYLGYMSRVEKLQAMFHELLLQLIEDGTYGESPIGEAFVRLHDEPGRAWNMDEWNARRISQMASLK
ncbi:MAG: nucleotidyltransferase domain-containing protein [Anaerolineales bacterium]|nr:nucleotidyltransferase domain-containing protein [Anaerolineales bacterium]MCA9928711.1 nucleotidyltransferase domain-containing protein [Anaerolineales bacterium]